MDESCNILKILFLSLLTMGSWPAAGDLHVAEVTSSSVTLTWTAPGDDGQVGTASLYDIRYSTNSINEANWRNAIQVSELPSPQPAGTREQYVVTDLAQSTTYFFAIKSSDESQNWSGLSNVILVTTDDETPPDAVSDLTAQTGDNPGELILSWTATGDDGQVGAAEYYEILYALDTTIDSEWQRVANPPVPEPSGEKQIFVLSGLQQAKIYFVSIEAFDEMKNASGISNIAPGESGFEIIADVDDDNPLIPEEYLLYQNFPNPFNPQTTIVYDVASQSQVSLRIFNAVGQHVVTLVDRIQPSGQYKVFWNGSDSDGKPVASGVYIYQMAAGDYTDAKTMIVLK